MQLLHKITFDCLRQYSLCCCCAAVASGLVVATVKGALQCLHIHLRRQHNISAVHLQVQDLHNGTGRGGGRGPQ